MEYSDEKQIYYVLRHLEQREIIQLLRQLTGNFKKISDDQLTRTYTN